MHMDSTVGQPHGLYLSYTFKLLMLPQMQGQYLFVTD